MEQITVPYGLVGYPTNPANLVDFSWKASDPAAIHVTFHGVGGDVEWIFGRELLFDGISSIIRVGHGDVGVSAHSIEPLSGTQRFRIYLSSPEGDGTATLESKPVLEFLQRTERLLATAVFEGSEEEQVIQRELDFAIEAILSKASES